MGKRDNPIKRQRKPMTDEERSNYFASGVMQQALHIGTGGAKHYINRATRGIIPPVAKETVEKASEAVDKVYKPRQLRGKKRESA